MGLYHTSYIIYMLSIASLSETILIPSCFALFSLLAPGSSPTIRNLVSLVTEFLTSIPSLFSFSTIASLEILKVPVIQQTILPTSIFLILGCIIFISSMIISLFLLT
nr:MAG TPA: hypothetical protein [Caudoviricetes sp.]